MESPRRHVLQSFQQALEDLRAQTQMMGALARRNLHHALRGLFERDVDLCRFVIADDEEVDILEKQVDEAAMRAILQFQPVAVDLRDTLAAAKISEHLEQLADAAVAVAKRARKLIALDIDIDLRGLRGFAVEVEAMVDDALKAYQEGDAMLAGGLQARHRAAKQASKALTEELAELMAESPHKLEALLHLVFVVSSLRAVAELARAIGEDSVFVSEARDIRHPTARGLE